MKLENKIETIRLISVATIWLCVVIPRARKILDWANKEAEK